MEEQNNIVTPQQPETVVEEVKASKKKKGNGKKILIFILLLVVIAGCLGGYWYLNKDKNKETKKEESVVDDVLYLAGDYRLSGNNLENFDLYFLQLEDNGKNQVYSPLSIKYALAMLNEGTDGRSHEQIEGLIGDYQAKKYVNSKNMSLANAFFIKDSYKSEVSTDFIDTLSKKYNANVVFDSFGKPTTVNKWISDKTFGQIEDFFDDISDMDYILVNSLAIDMEWVNKIQALYEEYSFSPDHEEFNHIVSELASAGYTEDTFNNSSDKDYKYVEIGATANRYDIVKDLGYDNIFNTVSKEYQQWLDDGVCSYEGMEEPFPSTEEYMKDYMKEIEANYGKYDSSTDFNFYLDDSVKVFSKDLRQYNGTTLQYVAVMPKQEELSSYIKNVDAEQLNKLIDGIKPIELDSFEEGYVTKLTGFIPMFSYDAELDLKADLEKMGITDVFNPDKADLSKLTKSSSYIDTAIHKANIDFSNDGIKAAATTALGGKGAASCDFDYLFEVPVKEIDLSFNKPFIYFVRDKESGEVWFMGSVYEPSKVNHKLDYGEDW